MNKPLNRDWKAIRQAYADGVSLRELAVCHNVQLNTLRRRKTREGWIQKGGDTETRSVRPALKERLAKLVSRLPDVPEALTVRTAREQSALLNEISGVAGDLEGWRESGNQGPVISVALLSQLRESTASLADDVPQATLDVRGLRDSTAERSPEFGD